MRHFKPPIFIPSNIRSDKKDNNLITEIKNRSISLIDWLGIDPVNGSTTKFLSQKGTYETSGISLTFNNGITQTGINTKLGGTLVENTVIDNNNFSIEIKPTSSKFNFIATDSFIDFDTFFTGEYFLESEERVTFSGLIRVDNPDTGIPDYTATLHCIDLNTGQESEVSVNYFHSVSKQGVLLKSQGNTGRDYVGASILDSFDIFAPDQTSVSGFSVNSWNGTSNDSIFQINRDGNVLLSKIAIYVNDADAAIGGVPINGIYKESITGYLRTREV